MSSTNKTTNYELSQFVGSDKPAWLADYNQDMSKIDTQMKVNADASTTNAGNISSNTTAIGDLTALNTTAKSNLVSAVNEVNAAAGTAEGTAQAAATNANAAKTEADALTRYLSITQTGTINATVTGGTIDSNYTNTMKYALNADGTLGKIYGRLRFSKTTSGANTITLPIPGLNVSNSFVINSACYWYCYSPTLDKIYIINFRDVQVNTNGTITFDLPTTPGVGDIITLWFAPCLYFFTDFGDVVNPN